MPVRSYIVGVSDGWWRREGYDENALGYLELLREVLCEIGLQTFATSELHYRELLDANGAGQR